MLAGLQHNDLKREVVCFFCSCKNVRVVFCEELVGKLFQNVEDDLRVDARHAEGLKESTHALFDIAVSVVLSCQVLI